MTYYYPEFDYAFCVAMNAVATEYLEDLNWSVLYYA